MNFGLKILALVLWLNTWLCVAAGEIPLELLEESGVARNALVKTGIPLAPGQVKAAGRLALRDSSGNPVSARFQPLALYPDKSWKWVLAEFHCRLGAGEKKTLILEVDSGRGKAVPAPVCTEKSGKYEIQAGRLKGVINSRSFNLLENIEIDGRRVGGFGADGIVLFDENNRKYRSASAKVVEESPGVFLATGKLEHPENAEPLMDYRVRIFFHPDAPRIDFAVTLINTNLATELGKFSQAKIEFVPAMPIRKITTLANGLTQVVAKRIFQPNFDRLEIDGKPLEEARSSGAFQVETAEDKFSLGIRNFRNRWPKGLSADGNSFSIELLPLLSYKNFADGLPGYLKYNFESGKYKIKWGMAFTEYFSLDFSEENSLAASAAEMDRPVVAVLPPDYYASTGAFFENGCQGEFFRDYDRMTEKAFARLEESRRRQKEYGFLNYGDWFGERRQNWGNNEYDLAKTLFYHFMRTGNRASFRRGIEAAEHQADSDIVHASPDPAFIGANHLHSIGHTGHWTRPYWNYKYDIHTSAGNGHTWAQGLVSAWFLGGSHRSRDGARELAGHINDHAAPNFKALGTHERSAGWMLYAICSLYELDRDEKCLESARKLFQVIQKEQKKEQGGVWPHPLPKDHAPLLKDAYGNVPFLIGILLQSLRQYHLLTNDDEVKTVFLNGANWLKNSYHPVTLSWPYAAAPSGKALRETMPGLNPLIAPSLAYAARLTGDPELYKMSVRAMLASWLFNNTDDGKSLAQSGVFAADFIADVSAFRREFPAHAAVEMTLTELIAHFPVSDFRVRGPERIRFSIIPDAARKECELLAERLRHGARIDPRQEGKFTVLDRSGESIHSETFKLQENLRRELRLPIKNDTPFAIAVEDNMTGVWNISSGQAVVKVELSHGFMIGGVGIARYYLRIPAGTECFEVDLTGVHPGIYGILIRDNQSRTLIHTENYNRTGTQLPWAKDKGADVSSRIECRFPPESVERFFPVYLWAAGDIGINVREIPAELYVKIPMP